MTTTSGLDRWEQVTAWLGRQESAGYRYPDPANFMENAAFPISKREEEQRILDAFLGEAFPGPRPLAGMALDAGCGLGPHVARLAGLFHHVVALDADQERLREAEARARAHSGVRLAVLSVASPVLRDPVLAQAFNLVLSMQVLGHVGVDACPVALGNFRHLLAPGGTLVLGVPYVNGPHDETWVAKLGPTGHFDSYQASLAEFDDLARQPREGLLPVRHFSIPSVRRMLAREGFRVVRDAPYNWFSATRADLLVLAQRA